MKKNILCLTLAGALAIGALSGCSSSSSTPSAAPDAAKSEAPATDAAKSEAPATDAAPQSEAPANPNEGTQGGSIIIATENETPSLTPAEHNAVAGDYMNRLTYNMLFRLDNSNLSAVPDLVESYEALNDLEWQFKLREGVMFHNGDEVTAEDVKASLDWSKQFPDCAQYTKSSEQVDVIDKYTFKITTSEPSASLLDDLVHHGNAIVPKSEIDKGNDFNSNPIGSGPYVFKNWTYGDSLDFEAFEDYFDKDRYPSIKNMTWKVIPEGSSRSIALEAGEVDFVVEVATQDIPRLQENPNVNVIMIPGTSHNFMMINNELEVFSDVRVRKALDMAINKEAVVAVALDSLSVPVYHQVPTGFVGVSDENINSYDPEGAKALLAEAGVDPSSITFDIICSNDQKRRCGEVIQGNLAEIGINVTLSSMDLTTYLSVTADGDYQAAIGGYTSSTLLAYVNGVWHSKSINASNKTRTADAEVDALIDKASTTVDEAERAVILEQLTSRINSLTGQVPIYQDTVKRAHKANLVVPELSASGSLPFNMVYWAD